MCFPKDRKSEPKPLFDEEGTIVKEPSSDIYISEDIHEHIDSIYLNFDFEDGILAFVYESSEGVTIVWTSNEAKQFGQLCEALNYQLIE